MTGIYCGFENGFPRQYTRWGHAELFDENNIFFRVARLFIDRLQLFTAYIYVQTSADVENTEWLTVLDGKWLLSSAHA